jgi:hypothetical protein
MIIVSENLGEEVYFEVVNESIKSLISNAYQGPLNLIVEGGENMRDNIEEIFKLLRGDSVQIENIEGVKALKTLKGKM